MSTLPFRHRAVAFVRESLGVETEVLPQSRIEDEAGNARFDGAVFVDRRSSALNLAALWSFSIAAIVALLADRPLSTAQHDAVVLAASVLAIAGAMLLVAAFWSRRRARRPLVVELRAGVEVDVDAVEAAHAAANGHAAWIVAERGFTNDALATAARLSMRCFVVTGRSFAERTATVAPAAHMEVAA